MAKTADSPILEIENLTKYYESGGGLVDTLLGRSQEVKALDGVDLELYPGETLGIVGESGCGKTTLARSLLRLIEPTAGTVRYEDEDLTAASDDRLRALRKDIQYIFQDPFASLNPRLTVGDIVGEPLDIHDIAEGEARAERVSDLLETVGLNQRHAHRYPHEFSGGQRQRIGIARALAVDPEVIVCDEPVSALDVSVQAQILNLLKELQAEFGLSYIVIAHDLSVVEHIADRVGVLYLGEFAEVGPTEDVFQPPYHPYAEALLSAIPEPDPGWEGDRIFLSGDVPSPLNPPSGCRFHTRCPKVIQPEWTDMAQSEWRSLMDLKQRLRKADSLEAVTAVREGLEDEDLRQLSRSALEARVRDEFGLPETVGDRKAEEVFGTALDHLHDGAFEAAWTALNDAFESPCERTDPELFDVGDDHRIACLLYDDAYPETPTRTS
ncbi:ABC transporter ATP-binding protein [Haloarcula argentinensis]|uniref:ATP-binding cassette domain-containing protein n=1 Tax=Haloarcula argentinensis TaxID=43776 RepID=A0ABU2F2F0_HALAR|nr:oligopeptide/dipeptide ABC transporter ATP-binding protein [Haloarcula argentinensis]EMA19117.1 oligopeptide ABC transporter ATP-binding protein [Haloarcula argentinensis DSM 12282]MDS0254393.1 ATP-binding cassette domain-containing protein [Haloarcula argentinensis]